MSKRPSFPIAACSSRLALSVLLMSVAVGCSADVTRSFGDNPFSNPFLNRSDNPATGAIRRTPSPQAGYSAGKSYSQGQVAAGQASAAKASTGQLSSGQLSTGQLSTGQGLYNSRVSSAPLPAPGVGKLQPPNAQAVRTVAAAPVARTGTVAKAIPGWTAKGGTAVTLNPGETVETVANRYGVPAPVLLHVNGLANSGQAVPGQRLVIPTYNAAALKPVAELHYAFAGDATEETREVLNTDTLLAFVDEQPAASQKLPPKPGLKKVRSVSNIAAPISIKPPAPIAAAKPVKNTVTKAVPSTPGPHAATKVAAATKAKPVIKQAAPSKLAAKAAATKIPPKIAGKPSQKDAAPKLASVAPVKSAPQKPRTIVAEKAATPKAAANSTVKTVASNKSISGQKQIAALKAAPKPVQTPAVVAPGIRPTTKTDTFAPEVTAYASDTTATGSLPPTVAPAADSGIFRWPARGRVISSFGSKDISGTNNGINISMPEGTPVKAAEAGTVAYSGDDVKKYGKLVLIKHENGYVSAYAHNGELDVKKGEAVKRGQVIAKSGSTGDVTSPQLHFQLRKGEQPIDPIKLLDTN